MNSTDAFTRATLYHSCLKSDILKHIDIDNADLDTLRDLVNKHSLLNSRKLPIIISKLLTKKCLEFAINKFPNLKNTLTPQNIRIDVEDDELAYLMNSTSSFKPNIVCLVTKNIAVSLLGSSIEAFKTHLLNRSVSESSSSSSANDNKIVPKIVIKPTKINLKNRTIPHKYSNTFSPERRSSSETSTQELVARVNEETKHNQKLSRQLTMDSNRITDDKPVILENIKLNTSEPSPNDDERLTHIPIDDKVREDNTPQIDTNAQTINMDVKNLTVTPRNLDDEINALNDEPIPLSDMDEYEDEENYDNDEEHYEEHEDDTAKNDDKKLNVSDLSAAVMKPKAVDFMELVVSSSPELLNERETTTAAIVIDDDDDEEARHNGHVITNGHNDEEEHESTMNRNRRSISVVSSVADEDNFTFDDDEDF